MWSAMKLSKSDALRPGQHDPDYDAGRAVVAQLCLQPFQFLAIALVRDDLDGKVGRVGVVTAVNKALVGADVGHIGREALVVDHEATVCA
jgi:hypothetical protein